MKPGHVDDALIAEAKEMHNGKSTGLYQISVFNQNDHLIALFRGTCFRTGKNCLIFLKKIMIYQFKEHIPVIHESSFIHPQSAVTGNVIIGKHVYIGPGAAIAAILGKSLLKMDAMCRRIVPFICFPG